MITKHPLTALLLLVSILLLSCTSQVPVATNYPYTEQQKMQAAYHWQVLAADVVKRMRKNISIPKDASVFVAPAFYSPDKENPAVWTAADSLTIADESNRFLTIPFKRAYRNFLIERLVKAGYKVVDNEGAAELRMLFDLQVVKHADRPVRSPRLLAKIGRLFAGSLDGAYVGIEASKYEAIITTSIRNGNTYLTSHTGTYYINTPPWNSNYALQGKIMEVVNQ